MAGAPTLPRRPGTKENKPGPKHPSHILNRRRLAAGVAQQTAPLRNGLEQGGPHPAAFKRGQVARRPNAQSAGSKLWVGSLRLCLPTVQAHNRRPGALDVTAHTQDHSGPGSLATKAPPQSPTPPKTGGQMALHLPDAIPRRALTYARTRLGTPGSVRATSPLSPAETSLARGPGWGRQRRGP